MLKSYTLSIKSIFVFFFLQAVFTPNVFASLSGNYTINPGAAASASNYKDFASAISDLKHGTRTDGGPAAGPGVSGAVTFAVSAGTYTGQVDIPLIAGVSSSNTITFDGGNASTTTLLATSTPLPDFAVVKFDTSMFVTVKNFTITTTVSTNTNYSCGAQFMGTRTSPCNNNALKNCVINAPYVPYLGSYNNSSLFEAATMDGVIFDGSSTNGDQNGYFSDNLVNGCTTIRGFFGMYASGTTDSCLRNTFSNNKILNYSSCGVLLYNVTAPKVLSNNISSDNVSYDFSYNYWFTGVNTGIYVLSCDGNNTDFLDISGNKITSFWENGMNIYGITGTASQYARISNNFITNGGITSIAFDFTCIYLSGCQYYQIWDNSMQLNTPGSAYANSTFYEDGSSKNGDIRNNIFSYTATGLGMPFYGGASGAYDAFDYNVFYNADSAKYGFNNNAIYTNAMVGGVNANSFVAKPNFKSETDFHIPNRNYGKPGIATSLTTDIDGETRGTPPIIGADDFPVISSNDIGVSSVSSPAFPAATGSQTVSVWITNTGGNTVNSATIAYSLNGGVIVSQPWTGTLNAGDSASLTFTTKGNFIAGLNKLKVFTSLPNGGADSYSANDTLNYALYSVLNGVYTINTATAASATNFISFTSAADALNNGEVTGNVLINISPGTYTEQVELRAINGVSINNRVRFDGGDTSKVKLTWAGIFGNQNTIRLAGCSHVTFANMKITGTNPVYAWPVHFATDRCDSNKFVHCSITVPANIDNLNECPIAFCSSEGQNPPYTVTYVSDKYNEIDSCFISGGKNGVLMLNGLFDAGIDTINSINNKFIGNLVVNYFSFGIYTNQNYGGKILNNTLNPNNPQAGAIWVGNGRDSYNDFSNVSGNLIENFGANISASEGSIQGGLVLGSCSGGHSGNFRVSNNMIGNVLTSTNCIYMTSCSNIDVVFNTLNYNSDISTMFSNGPILDNSIVANNYRDNIFAVSATAGLGSCFFEVNNALAFTPSDFDYNIFYNSANNNGAYVGGNMYSPVNAIGALGYNVHSYSGNPSFVSNTDWHITKQSNLGITSSNVTIDIDGQVRAAKPCIGADEINIGCNAPALPGQISGDTLICQGQKNITYSVPAINNATTYQWSLPAGISIVSNNTSNTITVNFSDSAYQGNIIVNGTNTCGNGSVSLPFVISVNAAPIVTVASQNSACNGNCNGQAQAVVQGSGIYKYNWSTADTVIALSGLCAGNYTVTVADQYGCSASGTGTVSKPSVLTLATSETDDTCTSCSNGTAIVVGTGGTKPYLYIWDNGQTMQSVSGLAQGIYRVCIMDANGCQACDSVIIGVKAGTGISQVNGEAAITIYPNPNNGQFTVNTKGMEGNVTVELFNINGERVFMDSFTNSFNQNFDLSPYGKGVYIIQLTSAKGVVRSKIITQ